MRPASPPARHELRGSPADGQRHPRRDRVALRKKLVVARQALPDRLERAVQLQSVLRVWLVGRRETSIGAYWPIKGEFDPLPALYRWSEGNDAGDMRRIGLPVADRETSSLRFRVWYPGCEMELDAYDIPKPKGTDEFVPQMLIVPCLGFGPGGVRLGYGGGFFDRTLNSLKPRPVTVGVSYTHGFLPFLRASPDDLPLDAMLTEDGVMWQRRLRRRRRCARRPRPPAQLERERRLVQRVEVQPRRAAFDEATAQPLDDVEAEGADRRGVVHEAFHLRAPPSAGSRCRRAAANWAIFA